MLRPAPTACSPCALLFCASLMEGGIGPAYRSGPAVRRTQPISSQRQSRLTKSGQDLKASAGAKSIALLGGPCRYAAPLSVPAYREGDRVDSAERTGPTVIAIA
jgi:hypothetical protein